MHSVFMNDSLLVRQISAENRRSSESVDRRPGFKGWFVGEPLLDGDLGKSFNFWVK